jgi:hypothetical protein
MHYPIVFVKVAHYRPPSVNFAGDSKGNSATPPLRKACGAVDRLREQQAHRRNLRQNLILFAAFALFFGKWSLLIGFWVCLQRHPPVKCASWPPTHQPLVFEVVAHPSARSHYPLPMK